MEAHFSNFGALKWGHTFLFSIEQIFCPKLLYHFVAMIVLKRFRIVTHCCAASFSIKTLFCKTNNIIMSGADLTTTRRSTKLSRLKNVKKTRPPLLPILSTKLLLLNQSRKFKAQTTGKLNGNVNGTQKG